MKFLLFADSIVDSQASFDELDEVLEPRL
jgi:hypothetical protein